MFTINEREKLLISLASMMTRDRKERGLKMNHPESIAIITSQIMEWAREGRSVAEIMNKGAEILRKDDVMPGVDRMIPSVQVEATFPDGTKLVTVHNPIQ